MHSGQSGFGSSFPFQIVLVASCATAIANIPAFLLGAMAPAIRAELDFSAAGTGVAASVFFATSALSAPLVGRLVQRVGPAGALRVGGGLTAASMVAIGLLVHDWRLLVGLLAIAGLANSAGQTASNLTLAELAAPRHDGLAFGIKQGAVPFSTMLAGFAVSLFTSADGWRWAFVVGGLLAAVVAVTGPLLTQSRTRSTSAAKRTARGQRGTVDWAVVSLVAVGAFLASGAALGMAVYLVEYATDRGWSAREAGVLLASSSLITIAARVLAGWWMDARTNSGRTSIALAPAAAMVAAGAAGCLMLAMAESSALLLVLGTFLGLGLGWGWPGLMHLTIVQLNRDAAATATGVILLGVFGGGVVLPSTLGVLIEQTSYSTAWLATSGGLVLAAAALLAGHWLARSRHAQS